MTKPFIAVYRFSITGFVNLRGDSYSIDCSCGWLSQPHLPLLLHFHRDSRLPTTDNQRNPLHLHLAPLFLPSHQRVILLPLLRPYQQMR